MGMERGEGGKVVVVVVVVVMTTPNVEKAEVKRD